MPPLAPSSPHPRVSSTARGVPVQAARHARTPSTRGAEPAALLRSAPSPSFALPAFVPVPVPVPAPAHGRASPQSAVAKSRQKVESWLSKAPPLPSLLGKQSASTLNPAGTRPFARKRSSSVPAMPRPLPINSNGEDAKLLPEAMSGVEAFERLFGAAEAAESAAAAAAEELQSEERKRVLADAASAAARDRHLSRAELLFHRLSFLYIVEAQAQAVAEAARVEAAAAPIALARPLPASSNKALPAPASTKPTGPKHMDDLRRLRQAVDALEKEYASFTAGAAAEAAKQQQQQQQRPPAPVKRKPVPSVAGLPAQGTRARSDSAPLPPPMPLRVGAARAAAEQEGTRQQEQEQELAPEDTKEESALDRAFHSLTQFMHELEVMMPPTPVAAAGDNDHRGASIAQIAAAQTKDDRALAAIGGLLTKAPAPAARKRAPSPPWLSAESSDSESDDDRGNGRREDSDGESKGVEPGYVTIISKEVAITRPRAPAPPPLVTAANSKATAAAATAGSHRRTHSGSAAPEAKRRARRTVVCHGTSRSLGAAPDFASVVLANGGGGDAKVGKNEKRADAEGGLRTLLLPQLVQPPPRTPLPATPLTAQQRDMDRTPLAHVFQHQQQDQAAAAPLLATVEITPVADAFFDNKVWPAAAPGKAGDSTDEDRPSSRTSEHSDGAASSNGGSLLGAFDWEVDSASDTESSAATSIATLDDLAQPLAAALPLGALPAPDAKDKQAQAQQRAALDHLVAQYGLPEDRKVKARPPVLKLAPKSSRTYIRAPNPPSCSIGAGDARSPFRRRTADEQPWTPRKWERA